MLGQLGPQARPPLEEWQPAFSGDIDIRIDADGHWYHEGTLIQRDELVRLFASILRYEQDLGFVLVTPVEKWRISVDDAPFIATALAVREKDGDPSLCFATNIGEEVCADADHPLFIAAKGVDAGSEHGAGGKPYVSLRPGICARLSRPVYYELVNGAVEFAGSTGVWSGGVFFPLGDNKTPG